MNGHQNDHDLEIRVPRQSSSASNRINVEPATHSIGSASSNPPLSVGSYGVPNVRDWYFFAVELQTTLSAGVPFVRAIELVGEGTKYRSIRRATNHLLLLLRQKSADKSVLSIREIPPLIRNLLSVGFRGGDTPGILSHIVNHYGWLLDIRSQVLRVVTYPIALVILGTLVMIIRDVAIASFKDAMPTTDALIIYSLRYGMPVLAGATAGIVLAWVVYLPGVRATYDRIILTAPVIGKMIHQYSQAVFLRIMAVLMEAGLPITDAWGLASQSLPNAYVGEKLEAGMKFLQDGESLTEALKQAQVMDKESLRMAAVGEMAGTTPLMLRKYADFREMELRSRVKMIISLIGLPCIAIVALGYFSSPLWLCGLILVLVFIRRVV